MAIDSEKREREGKKYWRGGGGGEQGKEGNFLQK